MRRLLAPALICTALAACDERSDFIPISLPGGAGDAPAESRADELTRGMTLGQAGGVIGMPIANYDDPLQIGHVCFSHIYGSNTEPLYIHTEFLGGHLVAATDGHKEPCGPGDI